MAKNYLADAGVTVFSAGGEVGGPFVGFDAGFASIELHVPQSQYETACKALESFEQHEPAFEDKLPEDDATSTAFQEHGPEWSVERAVSSTDFRSGSPPAEMQEELGDAGFVRLPGEDAEDGSAQDVSIQRTPDELALRAWRASFIGLIVLPPILHIYSIWLLLKMSTMDQE